MDKYVASNIKAIRLHFGLTQAQVADMAGVKHNTVSSWERGIAVPRQSVAVRLASALGMKVEDIMGHESGFASKPLFRDEELPEIPVCETPEQLEEPRTRCSDRFVAPPDIYGAHPDAVYVVIPDDRINRKIPRGYYAMVDTSDREPADGRMYCVCMNGALVFGYVSILTNGFELVPSSYDPTAMPVVVDYDRTDADVVGRVIRAAMPEGYEL